MLVSICLPVYNGATHLEEAVKSVLDQSHSEFELLIADDCSTDASWELVQKFAHLDSRIKIKQNDQRSGLFSNYNRTIGSASGEYIKLFAQDDLMSPTALATMVSALNNNQTAALVACAKTPSPKLEATGGTIKSVDAKGAQINDSGAIEINKDMSQGLLKAAVDVLDNRMDGLSPRLNPGKLVILKCLAQYRNLVGEPVTVMFRRQHQQELFSSDYRSIGDLELWFRLLEKGDLFYIPDPLVTFREHSDSRTSSLLKDIDWVLDFPRLSRDYSQYLALLGIDRSSYCSRFLELAAPLVNEYSSTDSFFVDSLPPYKELAYYLLRRLPAALDGEANYHSVLKSTSWKVTKPLRMFKRKLES